MKKIHQVLLIEPAAAGFHVFSRFKMPRLGLPLLGAILRQRGYEVKIHVGAFGKRDFQLHRGCDLVGLSTTTSTAPEAYRLADQFRMMGKTVVIGGVHATFMPDEALEHGDYVVRGEGEDTFPELLRRIENGEGCADLPGLSCRRESEVFHNAPGQLIQDLDRLPFPDFSLLTSKIKLWDIPIQTSRGCPYPCNFCSVTKMFGRKVRFRSAENVIAELRQIPKPEVFFYDDNFCARPENTKALLRDMLAEGIGLKYFSAQVRADVTRDLDLMELLCRAGCQQVYVGFESINPESLKAYDKRQTVDEISRSMEIFRRFKMHVHGMFVLGSDHDSPRTARETLRFARRHGIDTVQFMMLTPLPGTEFFQQLDAQGRIVSRDWSLYDAHHAVFLPQKMSPVRLQKTTIAAMSRFYSWFAGLRELVKLNFFRTSRSLMGWYIIRRWKWENRGWIRRLRMLSLEARRLRLQLKLEEIQHQLEERLKQIREGWTPVHAEIEDLRSRMNEQAAEIKQLARETVAAVEKDLAVHERKIEELAKSVRSIIDQSGRALSSEA